MTEDPLLGRPRELGREARDARSSSPATCEAVLDRRWQRENVELVLDAHPASAPARGVAPTSSSEVEEATADETLVVTSVGAGGASGGASLSFLATRENLYLGHVRIWGGSGGGRAGGCVLGVGWGRHGGGVSPGELAPTRLPVVKGYTESSVYGEPNHL